MDNTKADFEVVFDGGGGITLQTENYVHHYHHDHCEKHVAEDVKLIMEGADTNEWDGNTPEYRLEYGITGYIHLDREDIMKALSEGTEDYGDCSIRALVDHLRSMMELHQPKTA